MTLTDGFINSKIFFNVGIADEKREKVKRIIESAGLLLEQKFPEDFSKITSDIEFVICKAIEDGGGSFGGLTTKTYCSWKRDNRFFIIFFPDSLSEFRDNVFALAHEFAHVFYGHPAETDQNPHKKEEREIAASKRASEWGFDPSDSVKAHDPYFVSLQKNE